MSKEVQPEVNIGLVGHVDHGKSTLTKALSGRWTDTHSEEQKRGITIKLGYAECDIYHDGEEYTVGKGDHVRRISLVDAPGHESLMATMLAGTTVMDGAILLVAANERVPQAQTEEHLMALQLSGIENVIVAQNKIDLVTDDELKQNYEQIQSMLEGTAYEDAPVIPISAEKEVNISYLLEAIETIIPTPDRDESEDTQFLVTRSFDINRPGYKPDDMLGGVLGGSLIQGVLTVGDRLEIRPGRIVQEQNKMTAKPITTEVVSLQSGNTSLDKATPGGSLGVMTTLDPAVVKSDNLVGNIVGKPGTLPPIWNDIEVELHLLNRVVGMEGEKDVKNVKKGELLLLNVNSATTAGQVYELGKNRAKLKLRLPICAKDGARISISRKIGTRFRLVGYGLLNTENSKEV